MFSIILSNQNLFSQSFPAFAWVKHIAGSNNEYINASTIDNSGNIYITGGFEGSVDFDPGPGLFTLTAVGQRDVFIAKYSSTGVLLWAKQISGSQDEESFAITVDNTGNVYVAGEFESTADFDPSSSAYDLTAKGGVDIFLLKLDASGNFVWVNHCGGTNQESPQTIALDNTNNVYIAGYFIGTVDFDPSTSVFNLTASGGSDAFLAKFNANTGSFQWAKQFAGSSPTDRSGISKILIDATGNFYVAGSFHGIVDFDTGPGTSTLTSSGMNDDFFICKLDNTTNIIWLKYLDVSGISILTNLHIDTNGDLLVTGDFESTCDFDPGPGVFNLTSNGLSDVFLLKLSSAGTFIWALSLGGSTGYDLGHSLLTTTTNDILLLGSYQGTVDFDPGTPIYQISSDMDSWDIFILKLTSAGNFQWVKSVGGAESDFPVSIHQDGFENLYITGSFTGTCDFDPDLFTFYLSANQIDAFILKLNASLTADNTADTKIYFQVYSAVGNECLYIHSNVRQSYIVEVFDTTGKKVFQGHNTAVISKHSFSAGVYYLCLQDTDTQVWQVHRFVVER
ncbi:MAG: hypothetical protein NZ455_16420 [Bacteroidia bacterium]|nr:hypothetical protein [Bacteroidia bacterium]